MSPSNPEYAYPVHYPRGNVIAWRNRLAPVLVPLSWIYGVGSAAVRQSRSIAASERPAGWPRVVSVGNVTVGGTGKTPVAMLLIERARALGLRAAYVSRGYRSRAARDRAVTVVPPTGLVAVAAPGIRVVRRDTADLSAEIGDEAAMVAQRFPDSPLLIGPRKAESIGLAGRVFGAETVIVDDAFQSWGVWRDVDIVVMPALRAVRHGHLLPAGNFREDPAAFGRADILVSLDTPSAPRRDGIPVVSVSRRLHVPGFEAGAPILVVSAIGNPEGFEMALRAAGVNIVAAVRFPDHHRFDAADADRVASCARQAGVNRVICTEKDAVKLSILRANTSDGLALTTATLYLETDEGWILDDAVKPRALPAASP